MSVVCGSSEFGYVNTFVYIYLIHKGILGKKLDMFKELYKP
jgi:hypothetical protein